MLGWWAAFSTDSWHFLYSCENEFLDKLIKEGKRKLAKKFNLSYRYTDDFTFFINKRFNPIFCGGGGGFLPPPLQFFICYS